MVARIRYLTAVLGRHVGDGRSISQTEVLDAIAEELDELTHHASFPQLLHQSEHQVGGRDVGLQLACQLETHDFGQDHGDRLAQHDCFGLNTADAPACHAQTVDHRRVGVSSDQRVRVQDVLFIFEDHSGQMLQVDLMHDS